MHGSGSVLLMNPVLGVVEIHMCQRWHWSWQRANWPGAHWLWWVVCDYAVHQSNTQGFRHTFGKFSPWDQQLQSQCDVQDVPSDEALSPSMFSFLEHLLSEVVMPTTTSWYLTILHPYSNLLTAVALIKCLATYRKFCWLREFTLCQVLVESCKLLWLSEGMLCIYIRWFHSVTDEDSSKEHPLYLSDSRPEAGLPRSVNPTPFFL